ncbi:hypothetical protein QQ045_031091 [Rhodiola kirilowii]
MKTWVNDNNFRPSFRCKLRRNRRFQIILKNHKQERRRFSFKQSSPKLDSTDEASEIQQERRSVLQIQVQQNLQNHVTTLHKFQFHEFQTLTPSEEKILSDLILNYFSATAIRSEQQPWDLRLSQGGFCSRQCSYSSRGKSTTNSVPTVVLLRGL